MKIKIEHWPLAQITGYEKNARTHSAEQISQIAGSIKEFGFVNPVLVDADGVLIAGHGRLAAAKVLGIATAPVVKLGHLTEAQARALRLADNRIQLSSGWNADLLRLELNDLQLIGFDMPILGFESSELIGFMAAPPSDADPEETPEPPKNPVVRKGDLWLLGEHRILCGDSTNADDVAKVMGGGRPHLLSSDPPYGVDYDPDWRNRADRANGKPYGARAVGLVTNDKRVDWTEAWNLFPGDVAYCWHADRHASAVQSSLENAGFEMVCKIIWAKTRLIISRGDYHWKHEPCWYAVRKGKKHHWQGDRSQTTLWEIEHQKSDTGHGTQKPVECMKRPIENNSRKGDSVYDPFVGSGTTIIACEMTNRKAVAVEIDPAYVQVCIERWQTFSGGVATLDGKTLEQVAKARRAGRAKGEANGSSKGKPAPVRAARRRARLSAPGVAPVTDPQ